MARRNHLRRRDEGADRRQDLIRRLSFYSVSFFLAGVLVAVVGAALVALLLHFAGMPFLPTWLGVSALVTGVALVGVLTRNRRKQ